MPYSSIKDLPKPVKKLPKKYQRMFLHVFNYVWEKTKSDEKAFKIAWGVVKKHLKKKKIVSKSLGFTPIKFKIGKSTNTPTIIDFVMTSSEVDSQGERIDKNLLNLLITELKHKKLFGDIEHASLINTPDPLLKKPILELISVEQVGDKLFGSAKLIPTHPYYSQVLDMMKKGELNGISIELMVNPETTNVYKEGEIVGFSLVKNPALDNARVFRIRQAS